MSGAKSGSGRKFIRKDKQTLETVDLIVPPVSIFLLVLPYLFRQHIPANADKIISV